MERSRQALVFLDTHVIAWLYAGLVEKLSEPAKEAIEAGRVCASPIAELELQYLHEIGRLSEPPARIISTLHDEIGLEVPKLSLNRLVDVAVQLIWTRDAFDRLIVASAQVTAGARLVSKDRVIREHYPQAVW